ncbi:MAG: TolC family protein, partial [Bacteroidia bacterium]
AYYNVLVNRERFKLLDAQIARVKKLLDDTKSLKQNGFVEKIDVDRIQLTYNNLLTEKEKVQRFIGLTESLLKFQMGLDLQTPVTLSDSLNIKDVQVSDILIPEKFDYENRIEYSLLQSQLKLNELDVKRGRMRQLPSLVAYGNFSEQAMSYKFDFTDTKQKWYPIGIVGVTLSLPIFDGLQNHYRKEQSQLNLIKTMNSMKYMESIINLEIQTSSTNYKNAVASLNTQQESIKLAEEIFDVAKKKYDQGVSAILEVTNAETSLQEAQTNFYNALYEYFTAKVDYDKATGVIK